MSLDIQISKVIAVLLSDGWHTVEGKSFNTDAYEFSDGDSLLVGGGVVDGVPSTGASWSEKGATGKAITVYCPLTAILALKTWG